MKLKLGVSLAALLLAPGLWAADSTDIARSAAELDMADRYMQPLQVHLDEANKVKTIRMQIPANKDLPPHGPSSGYFIATVLSGNLQIGFGREFDASKLVSLAPGSVFTHPASQQHFARTGDEPVVLQVTQVNASMKTDSH